MVIHFRVITLFLGAGDSFPAGRSALSVGAPSPPSHSVTNLARGGMRIFSCVYLLPTGSWSLEKRGGCVALHANNVSRENIEYFH